jgi:hypothetical protein
MGLELGGILSLAQYGPYGGFHKCPKWMVYLLDNPVKIDDLRIPPFSKTSIWPVLFYMATIKSKP